MESIAPGDLTILSYRCQRCNPSDDFIDMLDQTTVGLIPSLDFLKFLCIEHLGDAIHASHDPSAAQKALTDRLVRHTQARLLIGLPCGFSAGVTTIWFDEIPGKAFDGVSKEASKFSMSGLAIELSGEPPRDWPRLPWIAVRDRYFAFCLVEVRLAGVAPYLRQTWPLSLESGPPSEIETVDAGSASNPGELQKLWAGVELIRQFERAKSGPKQPRTMSDTEFAARAPAKYCEFLERYDSRPSFKELADTLFLPYRPFLRLKDRYIEAGGDWPPLCKSDLD
jgi:hypothetical protein